ncbi:MAG TPA: iron-containing alcohol dehydrogenase [Acidimicrobiales bacterium]|nr:iron-containing alcohol dehydrogenase [Acidimicrobiales bacterium]
MGGALRGFFDVQRYATPSRPIALRRVEIGFDALHRLPDVIMAVGGERRTGGIVVLSDTVPKKRLGSEVTELAASLASSVGPVERVTAVEDASGVHADDHTVSSAAAASASASVIVTVGSGTMADIGKAVAARLREPAHVVVQTALSVNGYADDQSVLLVDGVKRTTPTRWPDALLADTQVLAEAPLEMNLAGVGDLLAMFTAPADWGLAHLLGMDDLYSDDVVAMVREHGPALLDAAPLLRNYDVEAIELTAKVLTLSGLSMGLAGTTAPASGAEHTVSHLIEMAITRQRRPTALHGAQVGVATVLASLVWQHVENHVRAGARDMRCPSDAKMRPAVLRAFGHLDESGAMAEECWRAYRHKLSRWRELHGDVDELDGQHLQRATRWLGQPAALLAALRSSGAPTRMSQLDPPVDAETARWALANCHLMRDRFTVIDLAFLLGIWEAADVDAILAQAAAMEGGL